MRQIKPATKHDVFAVNHGIRLLKEARECFKSVGASSTANRVRAALSSADGARRHVEHRFRRSRTNA